MAGRDDRNGRRPAGSSPSELFPGRIPLRRDESSHSKDADHDRGRGGGKGGGVPYGKHSKPPLERSSSRRSTNASDRGKSPSLEKEYDQSIADIHHLGSTLAAAAGQRVTKDECLPLIIDLLGDAACLRMQHNQADSRLKRTLADWKRSATKTPEYSSVDDMQRQAVQKCENEKNNLKQTLREMHPALCDTFDSLFKQYVQDQLSIGPNAQQGATSPPTQVRGSPAELQPQSLESQNSTRAWMENYFQTELNKFKDSLSNAQEPDNSEIQKLVDSLENEKKKTQLLENKVEEGRQQHQQLEEKLNRLEQKLDGVNTTMEERIPAEKSQTATSATAAEHNQLKITVEMQGRTINFIKSQFDPARVQKLQQDAENLADRLTKGIKSVKSLHEQNSVLIEKQGEKQKSLENDMSSLQSTSRSQEVKQESLGKDISSLRSTSQNQGAKQSSLEKEILTLQKTSESHAVKQKSFEKDMSLLQCTCQSQGEQQKIMDDVVSGIRSAVESLSQKGESLAEDIASLRSSVEQTQESQGSQEARLSTLTSLKPLVKEQQKKTNVLQQMIDALQASTADWSLQDFQNLKTRVQEYPPAGEIKQLLVEFPSLVDTKRLLAKYPPSGELNWLLGEMPPPDDIRRPLDESPSPADIKRLLEELPPTEKLNQLVKDIPKLRESMSKVNARSSKLPTSTPTPAFMTREMTMQLITPKMDRLEDALKSRCAGMIQMASEVFARTVDQANARTLKSEEAVQALDAHATTLKRSADENNKKLDQHITTLEQSVTRTKKDAYEMSYDMGKRLEEQTTELKSVKGMVAVMTQDVEKVRKDSRTGIDDVQFQLVQMTDWAKNFSSKQWHDSVAQQIAAYVPGQFAGQLDSLATRVSHLETRSHDSSEVSSKRRKGANGSHLVVNGIH
jgi:chromosome segregation ATPase